MQVRIIQHILHKNETMRTCGQIALPVIAWEKGENVLNQSQWVFKQKTISNMNYFWHSTENCFNLHSITWHLWAIRSYLYWATECIEYTYLITLLFGVKLLWHNTPYHSFNMRRRRRKTTRNSRALPATSTWGVVPFFFQ